MRDAKKKVKPSLTQRISALEELVNELAELDEEYKLELDKKLEILTEDLKVFRTELVKARSWTGPSLADLGEVRSRLDSLESSAYPQVVSTVVNWLDRRLRG